MALLLKLVLVLTLLDVLSVQGQQKITDEAVARAWLEEYNTAAQILFAQTTQAVWDYSTNITDYNQEKSNNASVIRSIFEQEASRNTSLFDWKNFEDEDIKRQFHKLSIVNTAKLPSEKVRRVSELRSNLQKIYSTGEVCNKPQDTTGDCYPLEPDLTRLLKSSRDYDILEWAWKGWRDATGKKMKEQYKEYVDLQNEAAKIEGFSDQGEYWRSWYESDDFENTVARLWEEVKPLYQQLHAYVRRKLMETYPGKDFPASKHIPAHLLGNMWAQTWESLEPIVRPYKDKTAIDVTKALVDQGYDAERMFRLSEEFFTSLGLEPMPALFWNKSMIVKPDDGRSVVCHASAWDFYNGKDFRIKQCTDITMDYMQITHHEMGHVAYFLQYKEQPEVYRDGANPGFHEAVGDVMSLSVSTPEHLVKVNLLEEVENDDEADINYLMSQALSKVAFLPFGYLIDQWRWSVFRGDTKADSYNSDWWKLRCKIEGISPPVKRSEADFDPGSKYHIPGNTPYIRYFVSTILQFQIHQALCQSAGHDGPLYRCDIYNSTAAGEKLGNMLKLGSSKKWPEALERVTGTRTMSAQPILLFFQKLHDWLKEENSGHDITWEDGCPQGSVGFDATRIARLAEDFIKSLGLESVPDNFWTDSMLEKPKDGRKVMCEPSAWDFLNGKDFRIKQCTEVTSEWLEVTQNQMGLIQYYLQHKELPVVFRKGLNPGFHEAVGDVMSLSVSTPSHLRSVGLLGKLVKDEEADINFLMSQALRKVAFLPFGYLIDQWRWSVFKGETKPENYNSAWWDLRCKLQGVYPPVPRSDKDDFDPGAKFHIPSNVPYIRYFVSFILQFQLHKSLCETAGHGGLLYECDIGGSTAAGRKLGNMLKLGSSVEWPTALEQVTGSRNISAKPMLEYFKKLHDWLEKENEGHDIEWDMDCPLNSNLKRNEKITDEAAAWEWLRKADSQLQEMAARDYIAFWNFYTNITAYNEEAKDNVSLKFAEVVQQFSQEADLFDWRKFQDQALKRQFHYYAIANTAKLPKEKQKRLLEVQNKLETIYSIAEVCERPGHAKNECFPLEPDLYKIMSDSRDPAELRWAWKGWRASTGPKMKEFYRENIEILNEAARIEEFSDQGEFWRAPYETDDLEQILVRLFNELKPLYEQLHAYVRRKLMKFYPKEEFPDAGHIPAHLLGNMWAQTWDNLAKELQPYPDAARVDVTTPLVEQGYNATGLSILADNFFQSLGLDPMSEEFWKNSMLEKPKDGRNVVCHASAWDMTNGTDFRIKQCTEITGEWLEVTHHEMGHIQYFMEYRHQPMAYRDGANPGFHEAIGDLIGISAASPSYLKSVGLLDKIESNYEADINYLMTQALVKIAFLPFGYLIDQWRWSVFRGDIPFENYNSAWWDLRCRFQGIYPPFARSDEEHFDPGAKYHIPANVPYIRYFVSFVLQFQFHKSLCAAANHEGPLYKCSIHGSKEAGEKLRNLLKLGSSVEWPIALEQVAGTREISAKPLFEYFKDLHDWLKKENEGQKIGWDEKCPEGSNLRSQDKIVTDEPVPSLGNQLAPFFTFTLLLVMINIWY